MSGSVFSKFQTPHVRGRGLRAAAGLAVEEVGRFMIVSDPSCSGQGTASLRAHGAAVVANTFTQGCFRPLMFGAGDCECGPPLGGPTGLAVDVSDPSCSGQGTASVLSKVVNAASEKAAFQTPHVRGRGLRGEDGPVPRGRMGR